MHGTPFLWKVLTSTTFADCIIADFDGFRMAYAGDGGKLAFTRTVFDTNNLFADNYGAAVVEADGEGGSAVRLQGCTFSGKPPGDIHPRLLADNRGFDDVATFYSDEEDPPVCTYTGLDQSSLPQNCISTAPKSLEDSEVMFLSGNSAWLVETQEVRLHSTVFLSVTDVECKDHLVLGSVLGSIYSGTPRALARELLRDPATILLLDF